MNPEWLIAGLAFVASLGGVIVWVYATFQTKSEAGERKDSDDERHKALEVRVSRQDDLMNRVAQDVSYIRGAVETRFGPRE